MTKTLPVQLPEDYQAALYCRRCGSMRFVHKWAERFRWWFCHRTEDNRWCMTHNEWS